LAGVAGDYPFLVGRNNPDGDRRAVCADPPDAQRIARGVELQSQPAAAGGDLRSGRSIVFAYARGEDQAVEAAQGGRERANLAHDAIDEKGDPSGDLG
jgi:hypothetical protein